MSGAEAAEHTHSLRFAGDCAGAGTALRCSMRRVLQWQRQRQPQWRWHWCDSRASSFIADALRENVRSAVAHVDLPTVGGGDDYVYDIDTKLGPSGRLEKARMAGLPDPFRLVKKDMDILSEGCKAILGTDHPVLSAAAKYFFELDAGKKVRPTMVLLMSGALNHHAAVREAHSVSSLQTDRQRRLAEITEMIHTASLFHDDVIDKADTRRGVPSANKAFGNKMAILAGDFLLARASVGLARLRSLETVELLSTVIEHLVKGEVLQMRPLAQKGSAGAFEYYVRKNYYKTGSLMSNSCRAAAILGAHGADLEEVAYSYGKRIGLAFQLIDDVLDFEGNEFTLGKPALSDIRQGLATAPVLLAVEVFPEEVSSLVHGAVRYIDLPFVAAC